MDTMTQTETGGVVAKRTRRSSAEVRAQNRAIAIRGMLERMTDILEELPDRVAEARNAGDPHTLRYPSWEAYVQGEFGTALLKLEKVDRRDWTKRLSAHGLSSREIAPVVNASQSTVVRDLRESNDSRPKLSLVPDLAEIVDGEIVDDAADADHPEVVAIREALASAEDYETAARRKAREANREIKRVAAEAGLIQKDRTWNWEVGYSYAAGIYFVGPRQLWGSCSDPTAFVQSPELAEIRDLMDTAVERFWARVTKEDDEMNERLGKQLDAMVAAKPL